MPVYEYSALDAKGRRRSGIVDAVSPVAARQKLREKGEFPTHISEAAQSTDTKAGQGLSLNVWGGVRASHVAIMTRQLSTLVGAGLPLVTALETIIPNTPQAKLKRVLAQVKDSIVEGGSMAQALAAHPKIFPPLYVNMVRAGEASGALEVVLGRLAELYERQQESRSKVTTALFYPFIMLFLGAGMMIFLLMVIVPSVTEVFADYGRTLPLPTRALLAASDFLKAWWWVGLIALAAGAISFSRLKSTQKGRLGLDKMILRIPLVRGLAVKFALARFSRTLASLLQNGVALVPAMEIVKAVVENQVLAQGIEDAAEQISQGSSLAQSLYGKPGFLPVAIQMMDVGEHSGELEAMLDKVADLYQREAQNAVDRMTTFLEPMMIILMAFGVGFVVLSILLPIVDMSSLVI
jgi:general secretion pathway protein F